VKIYPADSTSLFNSFALAEHPQPDVLDAVGASILENKSEKITPAMVSVLLRALRGAADKGYDNEKMLDFIIRSLTAVDPLTFNPAHIAAFASQFAELKGGGRGMSRVSELCLARAPNLFSRQTARATLTAFAALDMESDPVFGHLERIARGRAGSTAGGAS